MNSDFPSRVRQQLHWEKKPLQGLGLKYSLRSVGASMAGLLFLCIVLAGLVAPASASPTAIDSCTSINTSGSYLLTQDITDATGEECVRIETSDVIFDGNGHVIDGTTDPSADDVTNPTAGIKVANSSTALSNVTVRSVALTEWSYGLSVGPTFAAPDSMEVTASRVTNVTTSRIDLGGIVLVETTDSTVTNNDVQRSNVGIVVFNSTSTTVIHNTASETDWALWINESTDVTARNNHAADSQRGFYVETSNSITLVNNTAARNQNAGIRIERSTGTIEILNNTITGSESIPETGTNANSGIIIQNSGSPSGLNASFRVANNTLTGAFTGLGGVIEIDNFVETQNRTLQSVQVTNNRIEEQSSFETPTRGISLYAQGNESQGATAIIENVTITDNSITGTSSAGVGVGGFNSELSAIHNISIISNNISQAQATGVSIQSWNQSTVSEIDVLSNHIAQTDHDGILISSHNRAKLAKIAIQENRLTRVKAGIAVAANEQGTTHHISADQNTVTTSQFGFFVHARDASGISNLIVSGSTLRNSTDDGLLFLSDPAAMLRDWIVQESTISNSEDGIDAPESTGDWIVRDTVITNSSGQGVVARNASGNWRLRNVSITNTTDGIAAHGSSGDWTIENSVITNSSQEGVFIDHTTGDWTIQDSAIYNSSFESVDADPSSGNWTIRNSTLSNSSTGVFAENSSGNWQVLGTRINNQSNVGIDADFSEGNWSVARTRIADAGVGVLARQTTGYWSIRQSKILGNADAGVVADGASISGDATLNYWGAADGPSGDFSGSGDAVIGNVLFMPFYTDASLTTLSPQPTIVEYADPDTGVVDSQGLLDAAADFRAGDIGSGTLLDVAAAFRSGEPVT